MIVDGKREDVSRKRQGFGVKVKSLTLLYSDEG